MKKLSIIYSSLHAPLLISPNKAITFDEMDLQYCRVESCMVTTPGKLLEAIDNWYLRSIMVFTNFPPDSYYPEHAKLWRETTSGDGLSVSWKNDSYELSRALFARLLGERKVTAWYFITGTPREEFFKGSLQVYEGDSGLNFMNPLDYPDGDARRKALADYIEWGIRREDGMEKVYAKETQTAFLDKHLFCGLEVLETEGVGPDKRSFSEKDFRMILERARDLGIGVLGLHGKPLGKGAYVMQLGEWHPSDPAHSTWYLDAFEKMASEHKEMAWFGVFTVPEERIAREYDIQLY
ncbi:MAG: hypothetical protein K9J30_09080 [Bacteroidales bacterium]|nr:hypothetical protein [Bacteroidales bacterium]